MVSLPAKCPDILRVMRGSLRPPENTDRENVRVYTVEGARHYWTANQSINLEIAKDNAEGTENPQSQDAAPGGETRNRRISRDRIKINWKFDRRSACLKFRHKGASVMRS